MWVRDGKGGRGVGSGVGLDDMERSVGYGGRGEDQGWGSVVKGVRVRGMGYMSSQHIKRCQKVQNMSKMS